MIFISFLFVTLIFFMILAIVMGAPLVPSKPKVVEAMIGLLQLKRGEKFFDLGSGDGRLVIQACKKGAKAVGVEINPYVWLLSYIRAFLSGQILRVIIFLGNYWRTDLRDADAVAVYALPTIMEKLSKKLKSELKKGTRVVSNSFQIPGLQLVRQETIAGHKIYLYRV